MGFYIRYPASGGGSSANPSVGTNGATAPTSSTEVGGINGSGNLTPISVDSSGNVNTNVISSALPTGGATSANQATEIASLATIATNSGTQATAANQSTANTSLATIATNTGAATPAGTNLIGKVGIDQTTPGTTNGVVVNSSALPTGAATAANQIIPVADVTGSGNITVLNANLATGTPTAGSTVALAVNGQSILSVQVEGTWTGTLEIQGTVDNTNWVQLIGVSNLNTGALSATIPSAATGLYQIGCGGLIGCRVTASAAMTGTAIITARVSVALGNVAIDAPIPAGTNSIGNLGTVTTVSAVTAITNALPTGTNTLGSVKITDGTNVGTVKAASTAALATDTSVVVQLSPNGSAPKTAGRALANAPTVTTYGTPITSAAYTTIVASTTSATNLVEVFDTSGVALYFAVGAAGSEVNQFIIFPGGNGQVPLAIPAGTRISYKAVSTSASGSTAFNALNLYT
jgi:hypothetical protein